MSRIAIVGMACRYPDAASPRELWDNAVAGRRAFRRLPDERMRLEDYYDPDPAAPDRFYSRTAALLENYEFDRVAHRTAGSTYRSTDLTHWLALDTAGRALADAGFPDAAGLPRETTGVVIGNTLTGEFSRANVMRLRWPYVRRVLTGALKDLGWEDERIAEFAAGMEEDYKRPFPPTDEDTLAGGLANTIAGRICNYFDLNGGGYTVDGACSSSLLAVTTASASLLSGVTDIAVAGGVDLSIDPFEVIGFAKTGALARGEMRLYDQGSNGFWPGEGCGMVVLMREEDALAGGHRIYATIAGWGISSDGQGGITRPEVSGYQLALRRAYEQAGFGIETVPLFEGHGTGTEVGDATELTSLGEFRARAGAEPGSAVITSIKGMIGHTKAAAGVAGLIKAALALDARMLPPTIGCTDPHDLLTADDANLRALRVAEPWPEDAPLRAGVTAMGFGGINTHIALDRPEPQQRKPLARRSLDLAGSLQDAEVLLFDADSPGELRERLTRAADETIRLSYGQITDLAALLQRELRDLPWRAAAVVTSPEDAERQLRRLITAVDQRDGRETAFAADGNTFLGHAADEPRIGFLFPGQGSGTSTTGGALARRFPEAAEAYATAALPTTGDMTATETAQPRIATGSLAGLKVLDSLGIEAGLAVGHSLGELSALHWAGSLTDAQLLETARVRGRAMADHSASGTMASLAAGPETAERLAQGLPVVVSGYNGPAQTVVAGPVDAIEALAARAAEESVPCTRLPVSHAFHSPLVAPAAESFGSWLDGRAHPAPGRRVISTVTGDELTPDTSVPDLLRRQITAPVRFSQAVARAAGDVDLFVEVGPGRVLSGLAGNATGIPAVALNTDDESVRSLLRVVAAAWVSGAPVAHERLFRHRLTRPLEIGATRTFLSSPCEQAPLLDLPAVAPAAAPADTGAAGEGGGADAGRSVLEVLTALVAERAELPVELVGPETSLLDDLHLSSITVGQIVNQAATQLGLAAARMPTNFATASVRLLAEALEELAATADAPDAAGPVVTGAAPWARAFSVAPEELPLPAAPRAGEGTSTWQLFADAGDTGAEEIRTALQASPYGPGILIRLPGQCSEEALQHALDGAKTALAVASQDAELRCVLVQSGRGAAGLVKTLAQEEPRLRVTIVHTPPGEHLVERVLAEVAATRGAVRFSEAHYGEDGVRRVPTLRALPIRAEHNDPPIGASDVLLVTGGGKGISAECALAIARETGAALAVMGRSDAEADAELGANLARMADGGVAVHYARADVTDPAQVRAALAELTGRLGPVTGLLHGAGRNEPAPLTTLRRDDLRRTFAPKVDGLRHVLDAVGAENLKLLVTFGSIIGRAGLRGEAHYATANEWLADLTESVARDHPGLRARCVEWSVWSGVGMGEKLSVVETLSREGIAPVSPEQGVEILLRLITDPDAPVVSVVSGRTEGISTVRRHQPPLPLLRFTATPLIRYHGVELVTEAELNVGSDPYLADHHLDGNLLMPAVMGMEAMTQVAFAATGRTGTPVLEDVRFSRPIVVPPDGSAHIRIAATVTGPDTVDVAVFTKETGYAAEHFRARVVHTTTPPAEGRPDVSTAPLGPVPLDPDADLYGSVLFQGTRFQRLRRYHRAAARDVDADLTLAGTGGWFAGYLPATLLLADPGMRDALMHGNQVCVPDATLLPSGIERLTPLTAAQLPGDLDELRYCATERSRDGDTYIYDIAVRTPDGTVVERWDGLTLHAVRKNDGAGPWPPALLGSYLERSLEDVLGASIAVVVEPDPDDEGDAPGPGAVATRTKKVTRSRRAATLTAVQRALGAPAELRYRPDGKPELAGGRHVSAAHGMNLTLATVSDTAVACDVEPVCVRTEKDWAGLLGDHAPLAELVARTTGEAPDTAATRVWSAVECLKKAGHLTTTSLTLLPRTKANWVLFKSGDLEIATFVTALRTSLEPAVFAVLAEPGKGDEGHE
ncbi:type I polyketide synthase [Streptomyces drozdowiczii]|uniref:type I polyketide synthase n=1 Tax=Streptomyces drozdowiczii TaxID=202862 RepID=UPI0022471C62|nr:type I polyketide synthase [Streptomyces drozdowiczii]MCX0241703.1 type I polyketide synthase [Streptomyces drozdowiczii]